MKSLLVCRSCSAVVDVRRLDILGRLHLISERGIYVGSALGSKS